MNTSYLDMIAGRKPSHTPVWFMRQAGRSQAEYRRIKAKYSLFEITRQPELCAYITQLPVVEYGVDAAILYKDIMSPLPAIGVDVEIRAGIGPVIAHPIRSLADVERLGFLHMEESLPYILETIKLLTSEILQVPLIGFAGAPFTLASYLVEGGPSKSYNKTRAMLLTEPALWRALMEKLTAMTLAYLRGQVQAGAQALQIFDSWIGILSQAQYHESVLPFMQEIVGTLKAEFPEVPITMHGIGTAHLLTEWRQLPLDVIGVDWRCSLAEAHQLGITQTLQGNLDPVYLLADWSVIQPAIDTILEEGRAHGRHIFNLGHGVWPEANPEMLKRITSYVHERTGR